MDFLVCSDGRAESFSRSALAAWLGVFVALLLAGVVMASPPEARAAAGGGASSAPPEYCDGCKPPLRYLGGAVADTVGSQGLTVTPIYWAPAGSRDQFAAGYESVINGFIGNVAAASGADTNVFSIDSEYYNILGGEPNYLHYRITAGSPVVDTAPLPRHRCKRADPGYDACVTDGQLTAELSAVLAAHHLPRGLAYFYPVFLPADVETQDYPGDNSGSSFCAYHASFGTGAAQVVYGNEPYPTDNCSSGQSPNANPDADAAIDSLSHEMSEAITDPSFTGRAGWQDYAGYEVGDLCSWNFGPPLGSTDPGAPDASEYNQVINGARYYIQLEFSNYAYNRYGVGRGCQRSEGASRGRGSSNGSPTHIYFDMSRNRLPANGRARSDGLVQVWDNHGVDTPGDRIYLTTYSLFGHGGCGTLKPRSGRTDRAGTVEPVYRASRANIACVIVANDAKGGRSASVVVYQGTARKRAPTATATFPRLLTAGLTTRLTTTFRNPTRARVADAQVQFGIFVPFFDSPNVRARQVRLSVSWRGRRGPFVPVKLTGSTSNGAGIIGVIGGSTGFNLRGRHTRELTYRIWVSKSVPRRSKRPILEFQTFLDQLNPASGAESVLATTPATNTFVR